MPTPNPRLTVTLEPSTAAQLRRMSELTGNSQSQMVSEILTQSSEVFERLIRVLEAAEVARQAAREETASRLDRAQAKVEKQLGLLLGTMDDMSRPLIEDAEKVRRRARRATAVGDGLPRQRTARGAPTPMSNRGSGLTSKQAKNEQPCGFPGSCYVKVTNTELAPKSWIKQQ